MTTVRFVWCDRPLSGDITTSSGAAPTLRSLTSNLNSVPITERSRTTNVLVSSSTPGTSVSTGVGSRRWDFPAGLIILYSPFLLSDD